MSRLSPVAIALSVCAGAGLVACSDPPPGDTYFEHYIQPVLVQNCANNTAGCHRTNPDDPYDRAAGNLDVTTFERISKRRDLLQPFGAYTYPLLLIKAASSDLLRPGEIPITYGGEVLDLEIAHVGGNVLPVSSDAFGLLLEWTSNGAAEDGLEPPTPPQTGSGACSTSIPSGFDATAAMAEPGFAAFDSDVQPILDRKGCALGNCHGAPQADFYITCGQTPEQRAFNYTQAHAFVGAPADQSQLLLVTLARAAGGIGHTGGDEFGSRTDPDYVAIRTWAEAAGPLVFGTPGSPEAFFADHVQPVLLQRGCAFLNCHSPAATNDYKLRPGSPGFFSPLALERNYELSKMEFMAMEFPDARHGRLVLKNLLPEAGGIKHRGGPALEEPGRNVATTTCPPFDPADPEGSFTQFSPFCTIQDWVELERARMPAGTVLPFTPGTGSAQIIYVDRPGGASGDTPLEFGNYHPGSELRIATFDLDGAGHLANVTNDTGLLAGCAGATFGAGGNADVRAPEVSIDGDSVAFAMRTSASEGLQIWTYVMSTGACTRLTTPASGNGITIDNFDPVWSPDGTWIVFASSRGGAEGPTRARSAGFLPQSDLWRMHADGSGVEQVTYLGNSELGPGMMRDGRITMTTEKVYVDPDARQGSGVFHQLSGRRLNWDRTDYHPLLAQRAVSPYADMNDLSQTRPSMNYTQATDIREMPDGDFAFILSDIGANGGGGALTILNRSLGPFEAGRAPDDPGFVASVTMANPAGAGELGRLTSTSAYRGTAGLHDGQILTAFADLGGSTLDNATNIDWKLYSVEVDTMTGVATQRQLITRPGAQMDAVEVVKKPAGVYFLNHRQLVFGGETHLADHTDAYIHFPDAPMLFTMLTGNLRRGRPLAEFQRATALEFWAEGKNTGTTANTMGIFQNRVLVGRVPLEADGSARVRAPTGVGVVAKLVNDTGVVVSIGEEHQFGPGEEISLGIREELFNSTCGGCHGSISGSELDTAAIPDVLTGASHSMAQDHDPVAPQ